MSLRQRSWSFVSMDAMIFTDCVYTTVYGYILMCMKYRSVFVCCYITQGGVRGKSCAIVSRTTWWFQIKGAMAHLDRRPSQNPATQTVNWGIQLVNQVWSYSNGPAVGQWIRLCPSNWNCIGSNPWSRLLLLGICLNFGSHVTKIREQGSSTDGVRSNQD